MIYSIYSIGKQGETAPPGSRKATFAAFSASAGGNQPSPCGLANLPLRRRSDPLEFWGNTGAFGKADCRLSIRQFPDGSARRAVSDSQPE